MPACAAAGIPLGFAALPPQIWHLPQSACCVSHSDRCGAIAPARQPIPAPPPLRERPDAAKDFQVFPAPAAFPVAPTDAAPLSVALPQSEKKTAAIPGRGCRQKPAMCGVTARTPTPPRR